MRESSAKIHTSISSVPGKKVKRPFYPLVFTLSTFTVAYLRKFLGVQQNLLFPIHFLKFNLFFYKIDIKKLLP